MIDAAKNAQQKKDTAPKKTPPINKTKDTERINKDSFFLKDSPAKKAVVPVLIDSTALPPDSLSINIPDSNRQVFQKTTLGIDTLQTAFIPWPNDTAFARLLHLPGLLHASQMPIHDSERRLVQSKDYLFYLFLGLFLFLGIVKQAYPGYLQNLFRILFQRMQRYKQSREMMTQYAVPSLLMNIFFFILAGLFITIQLEPISIFNFDFTQKIVAVIGAIALIYAFKAIIISLAGRIFHLRDAALAYAQIVFHTIKVAAVLGLPLMLIYAYTQGQSKMLVASVIYAMIVLLLMYRYIIAFTDISGKWRVNGIYFFIYLCISEIIPGLIVYQVVSNLLAKYTIS